MESLFAKNVTTHLITRLGFQFMNIQRQVMGMIGLSSGIYFENSFYIGLSAYANLTHTKVNSGLFGMELEQTLYPEKMIHSEYNIIAGIGTVKDNLFDNFMNIFGTYYYFAQPSMLVEINFTLDTRLAIGVGYRLADGHDENSFDISVTRLKTKELNNLNMFLNVKMFTD